MEQIVRLTSLTEDYHSRARILARVKRAVLSGHRQATFVMPSNGDSKAAEVLLQLAAQVEPNRTLQGRRAPSLIHASLPTTAPYPGRKNPDINSTTDIDTQSLSDLGPTLVHLVFFLRIHKFKKIITQLMKLDGVGPVDNKPSTD